MADDEPSWVEALMSYAEAGRGWVAVDSDGVPVGYVLVGIVDGAANIEHVRGRPPNRAGGSGACSSSKPASGRARTPSQP